MIDPLVILAQIVVGSGLGLKLDIQNQVIIELAASTEHDGETHWDEAIEVLVESNQEMARFANMAERTYNYMHQQLLKNQEKNRK